MPTFSQSLAIGHWHRIGVPGACRLRGGDAAGKPDRLVAVGGEAVRDRATNTFRRPGDQNASFGHRFPISHQLT
jgi:hypothetical protein